MWLIHTWNKPEMCYVAHSFLVNGEEPPVCIPCDELLTMKHCQLFCFDLIERKSGILLHGH